MTRAAVIRYVSSLPVGEYRQVLGAIRRAWKSKQTGKSVKRLPRRLRLDAKGIRWSHDVRDRDKWMCRRCGAMKAGGAYLEAAHIVPRKYLATKYDVSNGLTLCGPVRLGVGCHAWAHEDLTAFMEFVREEVESSVLERLWELTPSWKGWTAGLASTQKATP